MNERSSKFVTTAACCWALFQCAALRAQESVRMSLAGAEAAEANRVSISTPGYYNLQLGPTAWSFGAELDTQYQDNYNLTSTNQQADTKFRPQINAAMVWPVTEKNSLNLNVGVGYEFHLESSSRDGITISPNTGLAFNLYAGDFWINLHDRISVTQNAYQDPTVTGSGEYSLLQNALGQETVWDLNKAVLRFGYDHENFASLQGTNNGGNHQSEVFSLSAAWRPKPETSIGFETGASLNSYAQGTGQGDTIQWNIGPFYESQVSDYIRFRADGGYTSISQQSGGVTNSQTQGGGFFGEISVSHRLNQFVSYTLSGGRTVTLAYSGGAVTLYTVNWAANWAIFQKTTFGTSLLYNHGDQGSGASGETFDQYGAQFTLGRRITKKLSANLSYQYLKRFSDLQGRNYSANIAMLGMRLQF